MKLLGKNINVLKKALIYKHKICWLKKSKTTLNFVKLLLKYNFICTYAEVHVNNKIILKLKLAFYNNGHILKKILSYSSKNKTFIIKSHLVKKFTINSFLILSTSNGLIMNNYFIKNKIGGVLICKLYA